MKSLLDWIKSNVLADIAIVIVIASIGLMVFMHLKGESFRSTMQAREKPIQNMKKYMSKQLKVPSPNPNEKPVLELGLTFNQATKEAVQHIRTRLSDEAKLTSEFLNQKNQVGHTVLLDDMLPDTTNAFNARQAYLDAFEELLEPYDPETGSIGLDAGLPPSPEQIEEVLQKVRTQFMHLAGQGAALAATNRNRGRRDRIDINALTEDDQKRLKTALEERLVGLLRERAEEIQIYADPSMIAPDGTKNRNFPFQIASWALQDDGRSPGQLPRPAQLYEGQLEFWIQQDIARAIFIANGEGNTAANVLNVPVKRLIRVDVVPGYPGLHSGITSQPRPAWGNPDIGSSPQAGQTVYPIPPPTAIKDPNKELPDHFDVSPTGRASNAIYDVRHAKLKVIVDAAQLPTLLNAISRVNLMTVLDLEVRDVNEWEAMREGYVYNCDAVEVDMLIETIWLRDWTRYLMPEETKLYLGIVQADPASAADKRSSYGP